MIIITLSVIVTMALGYALAIMAGEFLFPQPEDDQTRVTTDRQLLAELQVRADFDPLPPAAVDAEPVQPDTIETIVRRAA